MKFDEYKKYRWFFTKSDKLVIGGKSAEQNDELLKKLKIKGEERIIMHTREPGSPFSVIIEDIDKISEEDKNEAAIFTGCFSRAWKLMKKKAEVDIFRLSQLYKNKEMKTGTWGLREKAKRVDVLLELFLTKQKSKIRAVPKISIKSEKDILAKVIPGKIDKEEMLAKLQTELPFPTEKEELLSALPAGGLRIIKWEKQQLKEDSK